MPLNMTDAALSSAPDAELVTLMRAGRSFAFASLMQRNNQRLYRLARGILNDDSEAEEVVQEGYLRAFTHIDKFKGESSLATWLARIVINEALGRLRRQRPTVCIDEIALSLAPGNNPAQADNAETSPEQAAARRELRCAVERAIDRLPPAFRAVFIMRAIEQMSIEETSTCLGIPRETVKTRFHRGNNLLRQALSAEFGSFLDGAFPFLGIRCNGLINRVLERIGAPAGAICAAPRSDRPALPPSRA